MLPGELFIFGPESISLPATGGFGWNNRWIEVDKCKKSNEMLSSASACFFRIHKAWWRDGLPCRLVFCFFLFLFLILFNFPLILHFYRIAFFLVNPSKSTPRVLVICQVLELKSEVKRQGLAVSGPKSELIERLKYYQNLKRGCRNTSFLTAGGTTRSGAKRGAFISADSNPGAPHRIPQYQTFLNLQPGDGNNPVFNCKMKWALPRLRSIQIYEHFFISTPAAVAQSLALFSNDVLPPASSFSSSPCARNPKEDSVAILEDEVWDAVFSLVFSEPHLSSDWHQFYGLQNKWCESYEGRKRCCMLYNHQSV